MHLVLLQQTQLMNSMLEGTTVGIALLGRVPLLEKLLKGIESLQVISMQ